jgi:predicted Ser/Thr protein kinase
MHRAGMVAVHGQVAAIDYESAAINAVPNHLTVVQSHAVTACQLL